MVELTMDTFNSIPKFREYHDEIKVNTHFFLFQFLFFNCHIEEWCVVICSNARIHSRNFASIQGDTSSMKSSSHFYHLWDVSPNLNNTLNVYFFISPKTITLTISEGIIQKVTLCKQLQDMIRSSDEALLLNETDILNELSGTERDYRPQFG